MLMGSGLRDRAGGDMPRSVGETLAASLQHLGGRLRGVEFAGERHALLFVTHPHGMPRL